MLCFDDCRDWPVFVLTYKNIWGGLNPPHPLLNTALGMRFKFFSIVIRISALQCFDYKTSLETLS